MTLPDDASRARGHAPLAFLGFVALMTSVVAMTIDAVLPALDAIAADLGMAHPNDRQAVIFLVFAGLGASQLLFGPLADSLGRRQTAMIGWAIYGIGTVMALSAESAAALLAGRFLQGFGAGGPRVVAIALIRDLYQGRPMARIMSFVMTIFMLVPMLAPLVGQGLEALGGWRAIFGLYLALAVVSAGWYLAAVPETLPPGRRRALRMRPFIGALRESVTTRQTVIATLAMIAAFGAFVCYLATAQQVLEELYGLGPLFPLAFSGLALVFAVATFVNGRLVIRLGMVRLSLMAFAVMACLSAIGAAVAAASAGVPPLWAFLAILGGIFACVGLAFGNLNALALQPLGHIAGTASSVLLSLSTLGSVAAGTVIAAFYDASVTPMLIGFAVLGAAGFAFLALGGAMEEGEDAP